MDRQGPEAMVVIVDVGRLHAQTAEDIFRCSQAYLTARLTRLPYATDKYAIVKMGSSTTSNHLHDAHGGYDHINIVTPLARAEIEVLRKASAFIVEQGDKDYVDATVTAADMLLGSSAKATGKPRIVLFTDCRGKMTARDQVAAVCEGMKARNLQLDVYIAGEELPPDDEESPGSLDEEHVASSAASLNPAGGDENFWTNFVYLRRMARTCSGTVRSVRSALSDFEQCTPRCYTSAAKFRGTLDITSALRIPVHIYGRTMEAHAPVATKLSWPTSIDQGQPVRAVVETTHTSQGAEIQSDSLIKGHHYGRSIVPVSTMDEVFLSYRAKKTLSVIKFVGRENVSVGLLMGQVDAIVPLATATMGPARALDAICGALRNLEQVAIARLVKKEEGAPSLVVLWPHDHEPVLFLAGLPTAEDMRNHFLPGLDEVRDALSDEERAGAENFVRDRTIRGWEEGSGRAAASPAQEPWKYANPRLRYLQECIISRAKGGLLSELPPPSEHVRSMADLLTTPNDSLLDAFGVVDARPRKRDARATRKGQHPDAPNVIALQDFLPDPSANVPRVVGEVHPVDDFFLMLSHKSEDLFETAVDSMFELFLKLIASSVNEDRFPKATECIDALRRGCIAESEGSRFNRLLEEVLRRAEGADAQLRRYLGQIDNKASVASALRMVQRNEDDSAATEEEEVEAMRLRLLAAAKATGPSLGTPSKVTTESTRDLGGEADLANMIDDIV